MIKITIDTPNGNASRVRNDGQLVACFVDCCRSLEIADDKLKEAFETIIKEKLTTKEDGK
jgi:hypothetical protein